MRRKNRKRTKRKRAPRARKPKRRKRKRRKRRRRKRRRHQTAQVTAVTMNRTQVKIRQTNGLRKRPTVNSNGPHQKLSVPSKMTTSMIHKLAPHLEIQRCRIKISAMHCCREKVLLWYVQYTFELKSVTRFSLTLDFCFHCSCRPRILPKVNVFREEEKLVSPLMRLIRMKRWAM